VGAPLDALRDYLIAECAKLGNKLDNLDCLALIDSWYPTRAALDAFRSNDVQSYSISGRSFSRKDLTAMEVSERRMYAGIQDFLYMRGISLVDNRGFYTETWPISGGATVM
jgi:hypothetical protein